MLYRVRDQRLIQRLRVAQEGRRRIAGGFGASLLLHAVILGALLVRLKWEPEAEPLPPPAPVSMIFEGGRPQGPSTPEPTPLPGQETEQKAPSQREASPGLTGTPPPPAVTAPQPEAMSRPPTPPPTVAPPQVTPVAPPVPPEPSEVTVPPPQTSPPVPQPAPAPEKPLPPVRQASPAQRLSDFPAPMDLTLGPPPEKPGVTALGRPLFSLTLPKKGPNDPTPYSMETDAEVGLDWRNALSAWVESHAYYPTQASEMHQQGSVRVLVTTLPNGRVTSVELEHGSGSPWLDLALQGMFRGARLPPLPKSAGDEPVPFHFTMHYIIVR
jgi:periplasmic protein TonB